MTNPASVEFARVKNILKNSIWVAKRNLKMIPGQLGKPLMRF